MIPFTSRNSALVITMYTKRVSAKVQTCSASLPSLSPCSFRSLAHNWEPDSSFLRNGTQFDGPLIGRHYYCGYRDCCDESIPLKHGWFHSLRTHPALQSMLTSTRQVVRVGRG